MHTEKRFLQEKNLMNSSCEALLKLKIVPNTEIRAPSLALFFSPKCFAWTLFSLYQLMIINGLPGAIPPPVEFYFSNPPTNSTNRSTQPQQAAGGMKGRKGSKAALPVFSPAVTETRTQEHQGALHLIQPQTQTSQATSDLEMQLSWTFLSRAGMWDSTQLFDGSFSFQTSAFPCKPSEKQRIHFTKASKCSPGYCSWALHVTQE